MFDSQSPSVIILDPGNFTPHYDMSLAQSLMESGWHVEWVTSPHPFERMSPPEGLQVEEAFFRRLNSKPWIGMLHRAAEVRRLVKAACYPVEMLSFHRFLKTKVPGIIHVQWSHLPWLDSKLWESWKQLGWKVIYTAHDVRPLAGTTPEWMDHSFRRVFKKADAIVVHSEDAGRALEQLGVNGSKVLFLPPAASLTCADPPSRAEARQELRLSLDEPVILFFGFVKPYKGLSILLRSFAEARKVLGGTLVIAGEVLESQRKYRKLIDELSLSAHVVWSGNYVPSSRVAFYFAAADIVTLPYLDASSSAVLLTAYGYARPVIATTVGGLPELVEAGSTGILVPPGDPSALSSALIDLLRNPIRAEKMGERARFLAEHNYTWPLLTRRLSALYRRLWTQQGSPTLTVTARVAT